MKRLFSILIICFLILALLPTVAFAATSDVYVSSTGSDENSGTEQSPYQTLGKALELVPDGGMIHIVGAVAVSADFTWPDSDKSVFITGGILDFTAIPQNPDRDAYDRGADIFIGNDTHFHNITLNFHNPGADGDTRDNLFAKGNKVTIGEGVTFNNRIQIFGGDRGASVASTDLTVLSGNYYAIYGGGRGSGATVEGNTNLLVGGTTNENATPFEDAGHDEDFMVFGAGHTSTVKGTANLTFTGNAKANYIYGGTKMGGSTAVGGGTNLVFSGGQAFGIYGGSYVSTQGSNVNLTITGGQVSQVFGGCYESSFIGDVNLRVLGGTIRRRIYGGCYNNYTLSGWASSYAVQGKITMYIGSGADLALNVDSDHGFTAHSRRESVSSTEITEMVFENQDTYTNNQSKFNTSYAGGKVAGAIHYFTYTANDNTITGQCAHDDSCTVVPTAMVWVDETVSRDYAGSAIKAAKVTTSNWYEDVPEITYADNTAVGTATASITVGGATATTNYTVDAYFRSLSLKESIAINFKVARAYLEEKGFQKVEFYMDGTLVKSVTEVPAGNDSRISFPFTQLTPAQMGKDITAKFYYADGTVEEKTTSVLSYGLKKLSNSSEDESLKKAIVDMLNYGAATQTYVGLANGESLVNADLGDYAALGTTTVPTLNKHTVLEQKMGTELVDWLAAGLNLKDSVTLRLKFNAESTDGLTLKILCDGNTWEITDFRATTGGYYAYFSGLNPTQWRDLIYAEFYNAEGQKVSQRLTYSIESYAHAIVNSTQESQNMKDLANALIRYGDSVYAWAVGDGYEVLPPVDGDGAITISQPGKQIYTLDGIYSSKNYYVEMTLSAPTKTGYVGFAHMDADKNHFYDAVSYESTEKYYHAFGSMINGESKVYKEPARYYEGADVTNFGESGMKLATLRMDNVIYTFINGERIASYLIEDELAAMNTVPVLYFDSVGDSFYNGGVTVGEILSEESAVQTKLAELTSGENCFGYVYTPNWNKTVDGQPVNKDATFSGNSFTYKYVTDDYTGDRRYVTGVNDRVFLADDYYYQYEISGDMAFANGSNVYGLLFNWINTKGLTEGYYKHEANFVLKLKDAKTLERLTFSHGVGVNGDGVQNDGSNHWGSNNTIYGGRNDLANDTNWQEDFRGGLIVRIERTVKNSTTDVYVISVTAKSDPTLKITSTPIEVSDATFGGYNWILFGTQSVDCTISNVEYGKLHHYSTEGVQVKAPTCSEPGIMRYPCTDAGFEHLYKDVEIPVVAQNHTLWNYTYVWNGTQCTATRACEGCGTTETETVRGQIVDITPATKTATGKAVCNAVFQNSYFNDNADAACTGHEAVLPANTPFSITEGGKQHYAFDGIAASKNYYIEATVDASAVFGYVGFAHWTDASNYFYSAVSYSGTENSYYHAFSGVVNGEGRVYKEPSTYYNDTTDFGAAGVKLAVLRQDDVVYTFVNDKRVGTYLMESELSALDTIPVLYFEDANGSYYDGSISDIVVVTDETEVTSKLAGLTAGSSFAYVNTPNWDTDKGDKTDAAFNEDGFIYSYSGSGATGNRRYMTGVNDRVFLAGNYYYQYEISGEMTYAIDGLFFNWINPKSLTQYNNYKHEVNFALKLNSSSALERLTFDKGSGANGDGSAGWSCNNTAYGGNNTLASNTAWQEAFKGGLIVRIERTVKSSTTDAYVITVTAKNNPALKLTSTSIEVTDDTYGGYNWILFGTQSVDCTISNVSYGHLHTWEYSYAWSGNECTATRQCLTCHEKETETVQGQLKSVRVPTNETAGEAVYTADFQNGDFDANFIDRVVQIAANTKHYAVDGISASKNYYMEVELGASAKAGYIGLAHWADESNFFYDVVSYDNTAGYNHAFSGVVNGSGRVYKEPAGYYNDVTAFGTEGMTFAILRMGDAVHTFANGKRIGTYLIESELARLNTAPVLYFSGVDGSYYDGRISQIATLSTEEAVASKLVELTAGSEFGYVNTPNWDTDKGDKTDAAFNEDGFTYSYSGSGATGNRRYMTGVNDRVFLAGNYYYQYEISGEMTYAIDGLFFNWINPKSLTQYNNYKHEVNFALKLNSSSALERLTFDKGSGANGDGSAGWSCNNTAYGGNNTLASNTAWQEAMKGGLIVRIERTVKDSTTDVYVISVTAKNNPELKLTSTPIEVSDDTFGGYNWILFGTQSVDCTISNVTYGHLHTWEYSYTWNNGQCTATRVCESCGEKETETVQAQLKTVTVPTNETAGQATYSAVFRNSDFTANCSDRVVQIPAGATNYAVEGVSASKNYYMEVKLSASTAYGYVGFAHWANESNYFYSAVSYSGTENSYYHAFSGVVNGEGRVYKEPSTYYNDTTDFATAGLKLAVLRRDNVVYTFVNDKRIGTYLIETELAKLDTIPVLYFEDANSSFYDGSINEIVVLTDEAEVSSKLTALTSGSTFAYVNTPNWDTSKGTRTDATFNESGFTYAYDSSVSTGDRRYVTGVNDRVFLAGNYYYQYEISGEMAYANSGLLFNWINTKGQTNGYYKHEANFVLKLKSTGELERLNFDKGSATNVNGDSANGGWSCKTEAFGGENELYNDAAWQEAMKGGLIVRIERTVKDSTTDVYVISVTAKNNPELKLTSTPIEVSDATFGGYNWILFGTQSVDCTISNVTYGHK